MNRSRRIRSPPPAQSHQPPPFCYDSRMMNHRGPPGDQGPPPDHYDPYASGSPFEPVPPGAFLEGPIPQQQPMMPDLHDVGLRDNQLPSAYRSSSGMRGDPNFVGPMPPLDNSAPYKILCITNINHKVSDGSIKAALMNDFSRFGDISVSICHDNDERLAYIYFRTYEEAREARHAKSRTLFFDRPIEIEPIFEPRSASPTESPPPMHLAAFHRGNRRSISPPNYYNVNGPPAPRHLPMPVGQIHPGPMVAQRGASPPISYSHSMRRHLNPPQAPPMGSGPMPYGRGYMHQSNLPPMPHSAYSSPPHDSYRLSPFNPAPSFHPHMNLPPSPHHSANQMHPSSHPYHHPHYAHPHASSRDRDRSFNEAYMNSGRSPRHEPYPSMDHNRAPMPGYPPSASPQHPVPQPHASSLSRSTSTHSSRHHPGSSTFAQNYPPPTRRSPARPEHPTRYLSREFRREKFGSEGYSIEPEDGRPSRVLIINNIDASKTELDLRGVFDSFGTIEDIEVRKISPDIASALIKFSSMDCAYRAKTAINGRYLGNLKCRICYGKLSASRRLWLGGFGSGTTMTCLEDEFGKFGNIVSLDYISGRPYAYIEYESANQAQFATHHLKGTFVAKAERRIRIEYVDPIDKSEKIGSNNKLELSNSQNTSSRSRTTNEPRAISTATEQESAASPPIMNTKRSISPPSELQVSKRLRNNSSDAQSDHLTNDNSDSCNNYPIGRSSAGNIRLSGQNVDLDDHHNRVSNDKRAEVDHPIDDRFTHNQSSGLTDEDKRLNHMEPEGNIEVRNGSLLDSRNIKDIVESCPVNWISRLVLRNFNFPSRMYMCSGTKSTIDKYLNQLISSSDGDQCPVLRITQRWRLHPQPKLEEVKRRMQNGNLGMLIIMSRYDSHSNQTSPSNKTPQSSCGNQDAEHQQESEVPKQNGDRQANSKSEGPSSDGDSTQSRPLKNLISYLEQKDAAGVVSLNTAADSNDPQIESSKLFYAFPPGDFALELLRRKAPNLAAEVCKEEFLLGVIVGSADASSKM